MVDTFASRPTPIRLGSHPGARAKNGRTCGPATGGGL
jgi:hypothetical protein